MTSNNTHESYERVSHSHCWNQKQPPACGLKGDHIKCCLCDATNPNTHEGDSVEKLVAEYKEELLKAWREWRESGLSKYVPESWLKTRIQALLESAAREIEAGIDTADYTQSPWPPETEPEKDGWNTGLQTAAQIIRHLGTDAKS